MHKGCKCWGFRYSKGRAESNRIRTQAAIFLLPLIFSVLVSCDGGDSGKWKAPKFVKEWEIREIKPGRPHRIYSMTATDKGVFLLVSTTETVYLPLPTPKPVSEMTEEEKRDFIMQYVSGKSLSGNIAFQLVGRERDEYIEFITKNFFPPKKAREMTEEQKTTIISMLQKYKQKEEHELSLFRGTLQKTGVDDYIDTMSRAVSKANSEEVQHYRVQHYDFDGNFIRQWPDDNRLTISDDLKNRLKPVMISIYRPYKETVKVDSRDFLIMPLIIVSDPQGKIYAVDYDGNKIVKFESDGTVLALWWLTKGESTSYKSLRSHRGAAVGKERLFIALEGYSTKYPSSVELREYALEGKLKRWRVLEPPKVAARMPVTGTKVPFLKEEGNVTGIGVDSSGGIYLFAEDNTIVALDRSWNKRKEFRAVLKKGFESPGKFYDPDRRREIGYEEVMLKDAAISLRQFTSEKLSWIENGPGYYYASGIHVSPRDEIYVTFVGMKPFGVIDAMVFNTSGEMIGYWKHKRKSYSEWFEKLSDVDKIETSDDELSLAFYQDHVFVGRTLNEGRGRMRIRNVVQKFTWMEGEAR